MDISDILNKEELITIVINELKSYGVKYHKGKKKKALQDKTCRKHIFRTHMHLLELTDVILASGKVVQIPKFVADSCNRILEQVETEGLFRKAGSFARQKEIRLNLESGILLGKTHHVIDVANVVKYFFRELPEPLIPPNIQETFLQSYLIRENSINAILLSCLLLPTLTINTLSFFMQFLYTVSLNQSYNKMSIENLAIIFTPGIMPYPNINSHRFSNHVKIISILIENSTGIGVIPQIIKNRIKQSPPLSITQPFSAVASLPEYELNNSLKNENKESSSKKKKKRRSDMFNGLKRIVGNAMGSSEFLDNTPSDNKEIVRHQKSVNNKSVPSESKATPCIKDIKKRKIGNAMSAKKKKDLLGLLPANSGGFLPNTPSTKSLKKSRLSFGGMRHIKETSSNPVVISMERRWSIVGSGWSKSKKKYNNNSDDKPIEIKNNDNGDQINDNTICKFSPSHTKPAESRSNLENNGVCIQIAKNEFEEIKERVAAIEAHISSEFAVLENSAIAEKLNGPEQVQTQYERIIVETAALSSPAGEQLAQRLNRGLQIRQSVDHCVIRSPSARKIGTIRRRSLEKARLSRNSTWDPRFTNIVREKYKSHSTLEKVSPLKSTPDCSISSFESRKKQNFKSSFSNMNEDFNEEWMSGCDFFNNVKAKHSFYKENKDHINVTNVEHVTTPISRKRIFDLNNTPIVPPRSYTKKAFTPSNVVSTGRKLSYINRTEEISGRASIARLRTQNAGMVMAKAKLFDGLECPGKVYESLKNKINQNNKNEALNKSCGGKEEESLFTDANILINKTDINISLSKVEGTPIARRIQNIKLNSPVSSPNRRQCANSNKHTQKQVLKTVITDGKLVKSCRLNERTFNSDKEGTLNLNKKTFTTGYPRNNKSYRIVKTNRQLSKLRTTTTSSGSDRDKIKDTKHISVHKTLS